LKLLETSVVIYRLIRSPERFVFNIDCGNMPIERAMKHVENVKRQFTVKQTYDPQTGMLVNTPEIQSVLENYFLAKSADGRGSTIESIGGGMAQGFTELGDIFYFQRKLYRALKYPMSRLSAAENKSENSVTYAGGAVGEITRDEIKWAKFLAKLQSKLANELTELFLIHLSFKGLVKRYDLDKSKLKLIMPGPNMFEEQMEQKFREVKFQNYNSLAQSNTEFSKVFLMRKYLEFSDEEIKENSEALLKDVELGFLNVEDLKGLMKIKGMEIMGNTEAGQETEEMPNDMGGAPMEEPLPDGGGTPPPTEEPLPGTTGTPTPSPATSTSPASDTIPAIESL
jgi:hypothetical protein